MKDWRVRAFIIVGFSWVIFGWASAWTEHQCETYRYQHQGGDPPTPILVPCVCTSQGSNQTTSPNDSSPKCNWPEMKPEWVVVIIGVVTFFALLWQVVVYTQMRDHTMVIERAYVTMSHVSPGLTIEITTKISVTIRVKNLGRTPARISDVFARAFVLPLGQPLPAEPDYRIRGQWDRVTGFLVSGDELFWKASIPIEGEPPYKIGQGATYALYLIGYVDYIDQFKTRHRAGYARIHDPILDDRNRYTKPDPAKSANPVLSGFRVLDAEAYDKRSNLLFVTQAGYNYARPREKGEGNDWDEPAE